MMNKFNFSKYCSYHIGVPEKCEKMVTYCLTNNGAKEIRQNEIGIFVTTPNKIAGLEPLKEGFHMKLPCKMPLSILSQIIGFFKEIHKRYGSEAMVQIYWDREKKGYLLSVPRQEVSAASVNFKRDKRMDKKYLLVSDVHSHGTMSSFFSGIDDKDEKEARLYGVVGNIEEEIPTIKFRASSGGSTVDVSLKDIFDISFDFPKEWFDRVKEKKEDVSLTQTGLWGDKAKEMKGIGDMPELSSESRSKVDKTFNTLMDEFDPIELEELLGRLMATPIYDNFF